MNETCKEFLKILKTSKVKVNFNTATLRHNTKYESGRDKKPKCHKLTNYSYAVIVTVIIVFLFSFPRWNDAISLCKSGF